MSEEDFIIHFSLFKSTFCNMVFVQACTDPSVYIFIYWFYALDQLKIHSRIIYALVFFSPLFEHYHTSIRYYTI